MENKTKPSGSATLNVGDKTLELPVLSGSVGPDVIDVKSLLNEHRGETTVEVVSAVPFSTAQQTKLAKAVEASIGKKIKLGIEIDKTVIGGLIVKVGSRMIDTTVKTKLLKLQNIMKEVN